MPTTTGITLAQLLKSLTFDQNLTTLIAYYQKVGFPTSSWQDFDTDLTRSQAFATAITDAVTNQVPAIAGGSLLDYAPNYPGWTALTAAQIFSLTQLAATYTVGNVLATNSSGSAYTFSPSNPLIIAFAASGKRYKSTGSGTIPANGTLTIQVQAEFAGASYVDPSNSGDISIVTPSMPGVAITNPSTTFTAITHTGSGLGTVVPTGSPALAHSVLVTVLATSTAGPPNFSYSIDAQTPVSSTLASLSNIGGTGINIALNDGAGGVSWVEGDTYEFTTPASWITSQGADTQEDLSLADDCRNRWATVRIVDSGTITDTEDRLAPPTMNFYKLLAKRTPTIGAQVTEVFVVPDATINNKVNIIVAGPGGVLPSATITAIQNWITPWARGCDIPVVQSPTTTPVTIALSATALVSQLAAATAAATTALLDYIASIHVNGTIELGEVIAIVRSTTGVARINVASVLINGVAADLVLGGPTSYVLPAYPPTLNITWATQ